MTSADEVLDALLTADWLATKNPGVDRLKVLTGALYQCRLDGLTHDEHGILIAAGELANYRMLTKQLRAGFAEAVGRKPAIIRALNAAEDMVLAVAHIPGVPELLAEAQRAADGVK